MLPKWHTTINLIISLILLFFLDPFYVLLFFASSVLIDFDHYLYYLYEKKDFSLKRAYNWHKTTIKKFHDMSGEERKKHRYFILIFHGVEILGILLIVSIFIPVVFNRKEIAENHPL